MSLFYIFFVALVIAALLIFFMLMNIKDESETERLKRFKRELDERAKDYHDKD